MADKNNLLISGMAVYTEKEVIPAASVYIQGGMISEISRDACTQFSGQRLQFPPDYHLMPGRIDLHIHGAGGADVMDATPLALDQIRVMLAAEGVTGFLATTITESVENMDRALQNIDHYQKNKKCLGAKILGIHLEGPFISSRYRGAHRSEFILPPNIALFDRWQRCAGGRIKSVTLAPELPNGMELIRHLCKKEVIASIGHTDANFEITQSAIAAGARHATHLFNAMRPFHHREPGCVGAILLDSRVLAELIVDGHHCHPAAIELALRTKGVNGLVLVSDAMRAKCCAQGAVFDLGGQSVFIQGGAACLENGTLAGSVLTLTQAVKNMLRFTDCTLTDLVYLTSINPAKALNIFDKKGSLALGKDADLTVLDKNWDVVLTLCEGEIIYRKRFSG